MIEEIFQLEVEPGTEVGFENDFLQVVQLLVQAEGYKKSEMKRSVENKNVQLISVTWYTVEDHTVTFNNTPAYEKMKNILAPHYLEVPNFQHFYKVY